MTPTPVRAADPAAIARRFALDVSILDVSIIILTILLTIVAGVSPSAAQTTLGTIRGTVYDSQQGIVPGVTVVVTDESTNVARETQTDTQGLFVRISVGTYTVTATLTGFKRRSARGSCSAPPRSRARRPPRGRRARSVVRISAEEENNITLEPGDHARARRAARLRDLPRNSRDIRTS
jgi:hypothetical protein